MKAVSTFLFTLLLADAPQAFCAEYWQTNYPAVSVIREVPGPTPTNRPTVTREFVYYIPGTLNHAVLTNLIALTNSRTPEIWAERSHPSRWPSVPPRVKWNTNGILYGMTGFTALSPCWEGEGRSGMVPITALTRRHGYKCGHGSGPNGFRTDTFVGRKVWFLTPDNRLVERRIKRFFVHYIPGILDRQDYMIVLFDKDLPPEIEPLSVVHPEVLRTNYPNVSQSPWTLIQTEQTGRASLNLPGWKLNTWKGGDSGSPDLLPMPGRLIFVEGRTSSPASSHMQQGMDELCRREGLDPAKYQLQWENLEWPER